MMFSILNMEFSDRVKARMQALGMSAVDLASKVGVSKGAITHWTNGTNQAGGKRLVRLSEVLECDPSWLASGGGGGVFKSASGRSHIVIDTGPEMADEAEQPGSPSEKDYALIPQYTAKGCSGNGYLNEHVEIKGGLAFKRDWLRRMGLKEQTLQVIYNAGDSNWPTLSDGEVLLADVAQVEPINGKMFALLDPDGELIIKRLIRDMAGGWVVRSDNQDKTRYPDLPISDEGMRGVDIIGRIVWRGGAM